MILFLYVDDIFLIGEQILITKCRMDITLEFEMKDLGMTHYFIGLDIWQRNDEIFMYPRKYIIEILCGFGMVDCKSMSTLMDSNLRKLHESNTGSNIVEPSREHEYEEPKLPLQ